MAENNFFSHAGSDGLQVDARATAAGYAWTSVGENIAAGIPLKAVADAVQGWINSDGHCANMMNPNFEHIGVGFYPGGTYGTSWTQTFGG